MFKMEKKKQNKKTTENKLHKAPPSIILQKPRDENGIGYLRPGFKQDSQQLLAKSVDGPPHEMDFGFINKPCLLISFGGLGVLAEHASLILLFHFYNYPKFFSCLEVYCFAFLQ